jgi:hypothetical protein
VKRIALLVLVLALSALSLGCGASWARSNADLAFDGGTGPQRAQVRAALAASSFDWSAIAARATVHVPRGVDSHAQPGEVWLDASLLDSGRVGWAVVQDEFAHQVDFRRLSPEARSALGAALGTQVWCHADVQGLPHSAYGCERFTSSLVWAYWQSPDNAYRPQAGKGEAAAMDPGRFRSLLESLLAAPAPAPAVTAPAPAAA